MDTSISKFWKLQAIPLFKYAIQYFISCFVSGNIFVFWVQIKRVGIVNEKPSQVTFNNSFHTSLNSTRLWISLCIDAQWLTDNYIYIYHQAIKESQCSTAEINGGHDESGLGLTSHLMFFSVWFWLFVTLERRLCWISIGFTFILTLQFCCLGKRFASS